MRAPIASVLAVVCVVLLAKPQPASADDLNWDYLLDGGALPFFWGSAALTLGATLLPPPESPRVFSDSEGGATEKGDAVPEYQVGLLAVASVGFVGAFDRRGRFHHLKGISEALVTTLALTQLAKNTFGRHRPSYSPASTNDDDRRSFFSGHASITFAGTTYLGLYLQRHIFAGWRPADRSMAWWEPGPLAALTALAVYIPFTRVRDKRHHLTDVLAGGLVGTSSAIGFFVYQELRLGSKGGELRLAPAQNGVSVSGTF